jgi:hypothetical protein
MIGKRTAAFRPLTRHIEQRSGLKAALPILLSHGNGHES